MQRKRILKWTGWIIGVPVGLILLLFLLFYFPPFQNWAVKQVASYASEKTGMQISVGHVRLAFPLDLKLDDVKIFEPTQRLDHPIDTVADIRSLLVNVQLKPLFHSQVMVDELAFHDTKVNTTHFISNVRIAGNIKRMNVQAHGIDIGEQNVKVDNVLLDDASILVALSDTAKKDTTPSHSHWKIALDQVHMKRTSFALRTPGDSLSIALRMNDMKAKAVDLDLHKGQYQVASLDWKGGNFHYDRPFVPGMRGFDYNHIALDDLTLQADSFYFCSPRLDVKVRQAKFREKSGVDVAGLRGRFVMDSLSIALPAIRLKTDETDLLVNFNMDKDAFADVSPGHFSARIHGNMGRNDLMAFIGTYLPTEMVKYWPNRPLVVNGEVKGHLQKLRLKHLYAAFPSLMAVNVDGFLGNLTNTDRLRASLDVKARGQNMDFISDMFLPRDLMQTMALPHGLDFTGHVDIKGHAYAFNHFTIAQGGGSLKGNASIDTDRMAYKASVVANRLPLQNFLPRMAVHPFTGSIEAVGVGTDFMSPKTRLQAKVNIDRFQYGDYNLDGIRLDADCRDGRLYAQADCHNPLLQGLLTVDGLTTGKMLSANVGCDLSYVDLRGLHLTDDSLKVALRANVDVASDLNQYYKVKGSLSNIALTEGNGNVYRPDDMIVDLLTSRDTTHAVVDCNDFHLNMDGRGGYEHHLSKLQAFVGELQNQLKGRYIDQSRLLARLPELKLYVASGHDNFFVHTMQHYGIDVKDMLIDLTSSPASGLNGEARAYSLVVDSFQLDTVRLKLATIDGDMSYGLEVQNGKDNPQYVFHAFVDGALSQHGTWMKTRVYDAHDKLGIGLGLQANMHDHGLSFHLFGDKPILGYKEFAVNDSNYIYLGDDRRVRADMKLVADDGMGVQIYSGDENEDALQDVTVNLHQFNLGQVLSVVPYAPNITGIMDGDFHLVQTAEEMTVSSTVSVDSMTYEGSPIGNVGTEFTYMPKSDGSHFVDGLLTKDGQEIGTLSGTYRSTGKGVLDASLDLNRMPMDFLNGFIPDKIIGFRGYADGELTLKGSPSTPVVNGELYLDSTYMYSEPYGVEVRFANDPVTITNSKLLFENFEIYANNDSPLNVQGTFDFSNMDRMRIDARMQASNYLLIDSKETTRSEAYGKAYVNFYGTIRGLLDNLSLRGRLDVLGTTDVKYNLKDSPLSTDNQLEGLVEFVNFNDTTKDNVVNRPAMQGLNMDIFINIDEGAHVDCYLNADHSNYVDVIGGGDMRLQYNGSDGIVLRGRYTIGSGEMKYALPVIPLKTFTISEGSYIEFTGDAANPRLNITATEETKSTVSSGSSSGEGRSVDFTCGVVVTQTLSNMGLEFTIDAPEDMTIHNQLQSMSKEDRGKLAVTMLTTGMYLADGNTSKFSMNSALSAFLTSQINQISNKALRSLDIGFGVDNSFTGGTMHTDYSFKFAKRFWNNRLRISVGGKLSSEADVVPQQNETFFDNVTFEYRLSPVSNKYLNLFYERDSYDWLEGNVSKFGGGFTWKRKLDSLLDLFKFKSDDRPSAPADSTHQSNPQP